MCAIAGFLTARGEPALLRRRVEAMKAWIRHRGPDADGTWVDAAAGVGLGHLRLSIIDLSAAGAQPMASASGRYVLTYNGEVYNFAELRRDLQARGVAFRGGSDTEVMLAAFDAWGIEAAVARFVGMFAFAVWDREDRALTLVRDRLGIKPLYWGAASGTWLFASEPKALRGWPGFVPELDRQSLATYFRWGYVPAPYSIFAGINKLEPGCMVRLAPGAEPVRTRYWSATEVAARGLAAPLDIDDDEAESRLDAALREAVRIQMVADVPLGAFLSGGIDSSLVVSLMQAQSTRPVRTFAIGFDDPAFDEAVYAKAVAAHIGTDHTELYVSPANVRATIADLPYFYDEPFADVSALPTRLVSELTRRHVTVSLSGDGGDELFCGYTRYHWAAMLERRALAIPAPARRAAAGLIDAMPGHAWAGAATVLPGRLRPQRVAERAAKLAMALRQRDGDAIYRLLHTYWPPDAGLVHGATGYASALEADGMARVAPDLLSRMQLCDMLAYLPDDILTKVDRASMAVALEARVPLLDHRVVELCWQLPFRCKVRDGNSKWLLRRLLARHVPPALTERPKKGFGVPIGDWLCGPLRDWGEDLLATDRLTSDGVLDVARARAAWTGLQAGRTQETDRVWAVLMFQIWRYQWRETPAPAARETRQEAS
jgi:asparagine synthase (glutamine-hydrolysing)